VRIQSLIAVPAVIFGLVALAACSSTSETGSTSKSSSTSEVASCTTSSSSTTTAATATDYSPIPNTPALTPQADSLDFGTLTSVTSTNGVVTLHLDRSHFYMGDAAKAHNNGKAPLDDFIMEDTDGKKDFTLTLDPKASLQAEAQLTKAGEGNNLKRENLSQAELVARMKKLQSTKGNGPVLVWLRHADGLDSPVVALADQYIS
jgi:hypothetical protein